MNKPYEIIFFFQCGWIKDENNECLVPVMFPDHTPPAPDPLLEMIRCNSGKIHHAHDVHVALQMHNCHVTSSANVMVELVSTAGQYKKTAATKVKTNSNLKIENDV